MAATIKDIANKTGLGLATISKYLNGGNVLEKNKQAIDKAIKELDFTPNEFARELKTNKSKTIGVVIPSLNNVFTTTIIASLEDILRRHGYGILVCDSRSDKKLEAEAVSFLIAKRVAGMVMMPASATGTHFFPYLEKKNIPLVLFDRPFKDIAEHCDTVLVDNAGASAEAVQYFTERGHKKIGIITGPDGVFTSDERLRGYREALDAAGIPIHSGLIEHSDYTIHGGYEAMKRLFPRAKQMTGIYVTNYDMTIGAILAVNEMGIKMPEELSFIGFDNLELARVVTPKLTIVEQPIEEIGKKAAELLIMRLNEEKRVIPPQNIVLKTRLTEGNSVLKIGDL